MSRFAWNEKQCLTQDVSKCEKILEMKTIDFSRSLSISKSTKMMKNGAWLFCFSCFDKSKILLQDIFNLSYGPSDRSGPISNFSHFLLPMDGPVADADIVS